MRRSIANNCKPSSGGGKQPERFYWVLLALAPCGMRGAFLRSPDCRTPGRATVSLFEGFRICFVGSIDDKRRAVSGIVCYRKISSDPQRERVYLRRIGTDT